MADQVAGAMHVLAETARKKAASTKDPVKRQLMLEAAEAYDHLAKASEDHDRIWRDITRH